MALTATEELRCLNAEMVGYLLNRRSPPRELIVRREHLRAMSAPATGGPPGGFSLMPNRSRSVA
jgi:hypothetical protein